MSVCLVCLELDAPDPPQQPYHTACLRDLFGVDTAPRVLFGRAHVPDIVEKSVGKFSISGVQPKAQARLSPDRSELELVDHGGRFIVKPDAPFPMLPANEHLTMVLAKHVGLPVPPHALIRLSDESMAYIVRRFDRINGEPPQKRVQEDFCSLAGLRSGDKYNGSAERCAKLLFQFGKDSAQASRHLFIQFLFSYLIGNGDLHLKNLSMLEMTDGSYSLSPAYDLVSTWIYGDHELALPVQGKKAKITRRNWLTFAEEHTRIPRIEAETMLNGVLRNLEGVHTIIARSGLANDNLQSKYLSVIADRIAELSPK